MGRLISRLPRSIDRIGELLRNESFAAQVEIGVRVGDFYESLASEAESEVESEAESEAESKTGIEDGEVADKESAEVAIAAEAGVAAEGGEEGRIAG